MKSTSSLAVIHRTVYTGVAFHLMIKDYEFTQGKIGRSDDAASWTNQDQSAIGRPVFWAGELDENRRRYHAMS